MFEPHPHWSPLWIQCEFSDEHPRQFYMGVSPGSQRVPNRFFGIRDFPYLRFGIRDCKAKSGRHSGMKVCAGGGMPKVTPGITELHEILVRDYWIEEPQGDWEGSVIRTNKEPGWQPASKFLISTGAGWRGRGKKSPLPLITGSWVCWLVTCFSVAFTFRQTHGFINSIYRSTVLAIYRATDLQIHRSTDLLIPPIYRPTDPLIYRFADLAIYKSTDDPLF